MVCKYGIYIYIYINLISKNMYTHIPIPIPIYRFINILYRLKYKLLHADRLVGGPPPRRGGGPLYSSVLCTVGVYKIYMELCPLQWPK